MQWQKCSDIESTGFVFVEWDIVEGSIIERLKMCLI